MGTMSSRVECTVEHVQGSHLWAILGCLFIIERWLHYRSRLDCFSFNLC